MRRQTKLEYRTPIHWKRYILLALILSGITAYCAWGFGEPQREKDRYCRKSEIVAVFRQNYANFTALAKAMPPQADWYSDSSSGMMRFRMSADGEEDVLENLLEGDALRAAGKLLFDFGFNHFRRYEDTVIISHWVTFPGELDLGVSYDLTSGTWRYYYDHSYSNCDHDHPVFYWCYDLLFNRPTLLSAP